MKVLFLDIDGVLNSEQSAIYWNRQGKDNGGLSRGNTYYCPIAVSNLQSILEEIPDLKIVVSSTWRLGETVESMQELLFKSAGIEKHRVIGLTPALPGERGDEIQNWLDNSSPSVERFVIVDDNSDMGKLLPHLQQTSWRHGLLRKDTVAIINYFLHPWVSCSGYDAGKVIDENCLLKWELNDIKFYGNFNLSNIETFTEQQLDSTAIVKKYKYKSFVKYTHWKGITDDPTSLLQQIEK